jgi:predicted esterase
MSIDAFVHRFEPATVATSPTLLLLHGTGGNEDDLLPLGRMVAPGWARLSPRGRVLERGMPRFFRRLREGVFDLDDLRAQTAALGGFVEAAAAHHGFDPHRVVALGYSNGANIAASLLLLRPHTLAGAVLLHAQVPIVPEQEPHLARVRVLLTAGAHDPLVPPAETRRLSSMLRSAGASVEEVWHEGGHELVQEEVEAVRTWLGGVGS